MAQWQQDTLHTQASLASSTTWKVGGPAQHLWLPSSTERLCAFLKERDPFETRYWLGLGSNVWISSQGLKGLVILTKGLNTLQATGPGQLFVEAGVPCAKIAKRCAQEGWAGGAFFAGIPGTLGGALAMNAGAFGGSTWPCVEAFCVFENGEAQWHPAAQAQHRYRHVQAPGEAFLAARLRFDPSPDQNTSIQQLLQQRAASQPIGQRSCGSVFKNPPGAHAAALIERSGLKGLRLGGAVVSEKHANFIINDRHATSEDLAGLVRCVRERVAQEHGVLLETEVRYLKNPEENPPW